MPEVISTVTYRDIPDLPGYRVGDDGSIWSRRGSRWKTPRKNWRQLKPKADGRGRVRIQLYLDGRAKPVTQFLSRLVLSAFVGPCPEGMVACHANDNPGDNRLANLRWDTLKANSADALRNGRYHLGLSNRNARFTETQIRGLRLAHAAGASVVALALITDVSETAIRKIIAGRSWAWLVS